MPEQHRDDGFTLIELLVVISIIGVLATLTVGLTGVASRKSKESRIESELNTLQTAIEGYRASIGSYPPDNPGKPSTNQLYYELSGTYYHPENGGEFRVSGGSEIVRSIHVPTFFGAPGFANSVRPGEKPKFSHEFKPTQYAEISRTPDIEVLIVPVNGPQRTLVNGIPAQLAISKPADGLKVNPWMYDSSSNNRNNRTSFDLWTDVIIGNKTNRFSNWEKGGVVIPPVP